MPGFGVRGINLKLSDLNPNPKNPRTISEAKLSMLKKSLDTFGDLSGVVYNRKTRCLVGGHQRSKIFDKNTDVTITKKYPKPSKVGTVSEGYFEVKGEKFSYREVYWDETKEKAANIAANKGAGEWDLPQLSEWLKDLNNFDLDFDMDLTMFDSEEIKDFAGITVSEHTRTGPTGVDEDEVPEKAPSKTKVGDIYLLGSSRLLCGDSTDSDCVEKLMNGEKAVSCLTDPPYSVNYENQKRDTNPNRKTRKEKGDTYIDPIDPEVFLKKLFDNIPSDLIVMTYPVDRQFQELAKATIEWELLYECIWVKNHFAFVLGKRYQQRHEPILIFRRKNGKSTFNVPADQSTVFEYDKPSRNQDHPTPKPVGLYEKLVVYHSNTNNLIYEPFGGSGTTLIACEKTNRKCFMMEIDPHYCDVIVARWEKYTGLKASLQRKETTKIKRAK